MWIFKMSLMRRKFFIAFSLLSIWLIICVWYSESHLSRLSVITTVHSYIYAGTLNSPQTNSTVKEDLNELHRLKINLEDLIKQYSKNHPLNSAANKSRVSLSDFVSSNQLLIAENSNKQNRTSAIRPSHERSTTSAEEEN